jgi:uncharacterized membrane protein YgdD (TMEM256/DUF423 family)
MIWARVGAILMFLGVGLGAFGAHALQKRLSPEMLAVFETGVRYHFVHALGLFVVAWLHTRHPSSLVTGAGWSLTLGVVVFSGSLYLLSVTGVRWLGAITPIGGTAFLVGWVLVALAAISGD